MSQIFYCNNCKTYTLQTKHCGNTTATPMPLKYSPRETQAEYLRKAKEKERVEKGIL